MPRIFIAVPLPEATRATLARAVPDLPGLRRVAPELLHVTLAFVGQLPEERVDAVREAVSAAAEKRVPFRLRIGRLGRFPERGRPTVLWAGLTPLDGLGPLAAAVRAELERRHVPHDPKPFRPHVTMARVREDAGADVLRAVDAAVGSGPAEMPDVAVDAVHVMESTLTPRGPRYASRAEIRLMGKG